MLGRTVAALRHLFSSLHLILAQMYFTGVKSIWLVMVTSVFTGGVSAWQAGYQFKSYVPMRYLGGAVGKAVLIELAPVLTALVMAGRVGAGIAAELGTMKVTEQIDAMESMAVDPIRYLVMPRFVAGIIMLTVLTILADFIAILGAMGVAVGFMEMPSETFMNGFRQLFLMRDFLAGLIKAAGFGAIIAFMGCYFGFAAEGGAEGVGRSTTHAVVSAAVLILVADYVLATLLFQICSRSRNYIRGSGR
ncbi:MAG: ABC transporter permease [candidate division Zixibacteria bacterium]|nr:ABC transporter permease [candidate division Zixibacteria bacterium]